MKLAPQLFRQIADPNLSPSERARLRCQFAKQLEEAGNYETAREVMGELWQGIGHRPVLKRLDQWTAAEVTLRAGVLTGLIGNCKPVDGAQEAAKNLISDSITRFEELQDTLKVAEAQMELGCCYLHGGAFSEARVWLREALRRLIDRPGDLKAVTLLRSAAVEKLTHHLSGALRLLIEAVPLFEESENHTLKGRFHNEYAQVLRKLGAAERWDDYIDRALIEYAAASYHFEQAGHTRYQAYVENNLGFLFGTIGKFAEAHEHLDRAQALFTSMKDKAHIAQVDDTRARVLLAQGCVREAEKLARSAVQALEGGDQQFLFAEALTTHGIMLARLGHHRHAHLSLQSAVEVAQNAGDPETAGGAALTIIEELGERLRADDLIVIYERAADLLAGSRDPGTLLRLSECARRVFFLTGASAAPPTWKGFSLAKVVRRYEKSLIERALRDAGGVLTRAARLLGYQNHNSLNKKLRHKYPELLGQRTPAKERKQSLMFINEGDKETRTLTILHVEDDKVIATTVKEMLEMEGWTVEMCGEADAALKILEGSAHYEILIFDNKLPGMDGVELIRRARRIPHRRQTPIIMLSAGDIQAEAHQAGANTFLRKPDDMTVIAETIARLRARRSRQRGK
jgi:CheY-like chemotaxis protein